MKSVRAIKAYGGTGGIFLKRRRKTVLSVDATTRSTMTSTTNVNTNANLVASRSVTPSPTFPIIGWDDVKCRPIFDDAPAASARTTTMASRDDDDSDAVEPVDSEIAAGVSPPPAAAERDFPWQQRDALVGRKRRGKVYGREKRERYFPEAAERSEQQGQRRRPEPLQPPGGQSSAVPFHSPPPDPLRAPSICDALNSAKKPEAAAATTGEAIIKNSKGHQSTATVAVPTRACTVLKKRRRSAPVGAEEESGDAFSFVDAQQQQPSSTASTAAARAFYDHLDATHVLRVVPRGPPSRGGGAETAAPSERRGPAKQPGRSTNLPNPHELKREYGEYCRAALESGVAPISIEEYRSNRFRFYRRNEMYDGFLE